MPTNIDKINYVKYGFMKFDLSQIAGSEIKSVKLNLYIASSKKGGNKTDSVLNIYPVTSNDWNEDTISAAGDLISLTSDKLKSAVNPIGSANIASAGELWVTYDLTNYIKGKDLGQDPLASIAL